MPDDICGGSTLESLTLLLRSWKDGDQQAFARIAQALQLDFRRMARQRLSGANADILTGGDVINEAWLRLMALPHGWDNRAHFFATASLTMRGILREHARAQLADKRSGARLRLTLTSADAGEDSMAADVLTLDALLTQLGTQDPRAAQVLELTYFTGLPREQIAEVMDLSLSTVDRELRFARAWLGEQLGTELAG